MEGEDEWVLEGVARVDCQWERKMSIASRDGHGKRACEDVWRAMEGGKCDYRIAMLC